MSKKLQHSVREANLLWKRDRQILHKRSKFWENRSFSLLEDDYILTVEDIAIWLKLTPNFTKKLCENGIICSMQIGNVLRIRKKCVIEYMEKMEKLSKEKINERF